MMRLVFYRDPCDSKTHRDRAQTAVSHLAQLVMAYHLVVVLLTFATMSNDHAAAYYSAAGDYFEAEHVVVCFVDYLLNSLPFFFITLSFYFLIRLNDFCCCL